MQFLYVFGFCNPTQYANNKRHGWDDEDSYACFIEAPDETAAIEKGRSISEQFVTHLFETANWDGPIPSWRAGNFAHWIEHQPLMHFSGLALESLPTVALDEHPDFSDWISSGFGKVS